MKGTEHSSELEKESIKWYQILQRCEGDFRTLSLLVIPALIAIGTEKASLIIESVKLLSSSKFIGSVNVLTAKFSVAGLESISRAVPEVATYLKGEKLDYFIELVEKRSKIPNSDWQVFNNTARSLLAFLGQHTESIVKVPREVFFPPNTQYDVIAHLKKIVRTAKTDLKIIDAYANSDIVSLIENCDPGINIKILSREGPRGINSLLLEARRYKTQYGHIEVKLEKQPGTQHNRYIIVDDSNVYDIGASINHIGNKATTVVEIQTPQEKKKVIDNFNMSWGTAIIKI